MLKRRNVPRNERNQVNSITNVPDRANRSPLNKIVLFYLLACFGVGQAFAADASALAFPERYSPGSIRSAATADRALAEAAKERARVEARYAKEEAECYPKFFVTSCIDSAKERRRVELSRIRPVEIEAKSFKRRARVDERDRALSERRAKEAAEAPQSQSDRSERGALREEKAANDSAQRGARETEAKHREIQNGRRAGEREKKLKQTKAEQAAEAKQRAENIAAYDQKVKAAQQHQRKIAAKKAEKAAAKTGASVSAP